MATKKERISSLQKQADKVTAPFSQKGIKRKKRVSIIFSIGIILALGLGMLSTISESHRAYEEYLNNSQDIDFEYLGYADTFERWNANDIGNDVNVLLSGGRVYAKNNLIVKPIENTYVVILNGQVIKTIDSGISYINVLQSSIIFRDDSTRNIHVFDINTGKEIVISHDNCGEVFVTNGLIYYVSFTDNSSIACINLDGSGKEVVVDKPIADFLVCGDSVVYLTNTRDLYSHSIVSNSESCIVSNIERFFVNGDLVIESADSIFSCQTNGKKAEEIYKSAEPTMRLVSANSTEVIYQEKGTLYSISINDGTNSTIYTADYELIASALRSSDCYLLIAYQDEADVTNTPQLVEVAAN